VVNNNKQTVIILAQERPDIMLFAAIFAQKQKK